MQPDNVVQWTRWWKDTSLSQHSRDQPLFEKLNDADDTSVDHVDKRKDDDDDQDKTSLLWLRLEQRRRGCWTPSATLAITGLCTTSLLFLITTIILWQVKRPHATEAIATGELYHCGNSTSEARALGCEFDVLSYSWTPQVCHDRATAQEFHNWLYRPDRKFGAFPFFFDEQALEHVPDELALSESHGRTIHTTQEEHLGHCTFMMRRWHRLAKQSGSSHHFNHRFGKYIHTKHCTERILNGLADPDLLNEGSLNSKFGITFEKC